MAVLVAEQVSRRERALPNFDADWHPAGASLSLPSLEELQSVLGYGMSCSAINSIDIELLGPYADLQAGRVEGLAPMDLLGEFREPIPCGEVVPIRLRSDLLRLKVDTLALVHWQRCIGARWLAGLFLRERLPAKFLEYTWMDMRRDLRYPTRFELQAQFDSAAGPQRVQIRDYSRSGARLECRTRPPEQGRIELYDGDLLAVGEIRYVRPSPQSQSYQVGCEFMNNEGIRLSHRMLSLASSHPDQWSKVEGWYGRSMCS